MTSLSSEQVNAETLLKLWRVRRDIKNRLFWSHDIFFKEDLSHIQTGTAYRRLGTFRNAGITLLRILKVPEHTETLRENAIKLDVLMQRLYIENKT